MRDDGEGHRRLRLRRSVQGRRHARSGRADGAATRREGTVARRRAQRRRGDRRASPRRRSAISRTSGRSCTAETFDGDDFIPVKELISWDAGRYDSVEFCGQDTYGLENAGYCFASTTPSAGTAACCCPRYATTSAKSPSTNVLAHEYGHAIQHQARLNKKDIADVGRRAAGRLLRRRIHALGGRGELRPLHVEHRRRAQRPTGGGDFVPRPTAQRGRIRTRRQSTARHSSGSPRSSSASPTARDPARRSTTKEIAQRRGDLPVELQQRPDRRLAGQRGVGERDRRGARADVLAGRPADAAPRSGFERAIARMPARARRSPTVRPPTRSPSTWPSSRR